MFRKHLAVFGLQLPQFGCSFGIGAEVGLDFPPDVLRHFYFVGEGTVLDVLDIFVEPFVHIVLHLHDCGRVGSHYQMDILFYAHSHNRVVTGCVVFDAVYAGRGGIERLHELRTVGLGHS